jgi:hypothetical protein
MIKAIRIVLAALLVVAMLISGCGEKKETPASDKYAEPSSTTGGNADAGSGPQRTGGGLAVSLMPATPTVEDALQAVVRGSNGGLTFRWERNGEPIEGQSDARLPAQSFLKGETVAVTAISGDAQAGASVTIANSPPKVISVPFVDPHVSRGGDIVAEPEGVDVDGDRIGYRFLWTINGSEVIGNDSPVLSGERFRKGDRIDLTVIPYDDEGDGVPFNGAEFTVPNAPPVFVSSPPLQFQARVYAYEARADDPDGDSLTYSLESAPPGMTIDGGTGDIRWEIKPQDAGEHRIKIVARDDEGMRAFQEFNLNLTIPE